MNLWQSSQKPCLKGLPGKHPIGTNLSKPHSDQESLHRTYAPLSNGDGRPGNCIFTWSRRRAGGTKPTVNPANCRTGPTDRPSSRRAKPTGRPRKSRGCWIQNPHNQVSPNGSSTRGRNMPSRFKDYVINIVHSLRPV